MSLKIVKRTVVIRNLVLFIFMSLIFLHVIMSMSKGISAASIELLINNLISSKLEVALSLLAAFSIHKGKRIGKVLLLAFTFIIVVKTFLVFIVNYDKFILINNFIYLLCSYYFFSLLNLEMEEAVYNPGFNINDIGNRRPYNIQIKLEDSFKKEFEGTVTNWNKSSCFISFNKKEMPTKGKVKVLLEYEGRMFEQPGQIITTYDNGVGVKFLDVENSANHDWISFYAIIHDRGYSV